MKAEIIYAPNQLPSKWERPRIFLAGSIEMGKAEDWQAKVINELSEPDVTIFNPRRKDWDSSWVQSKDNPQFSEQVNWELSALEKSDIIILYLSPGTQSPISLLELGLHMKTSDHLMICCPPGFWRKGNVDITSERYGRKVYENINDLLVDVKIILLENQWT